MSNDKQELIRRCMLAILQGYWANPNDDHHISEAQMWKQATLIADMEPPQPALVTAQELEHTREDWWELQGNVTRLTQDVERLFGLAETLAGRIRRAAALLRGATRYDTAAGYAVTEDRVDEAVQILEEGSDD
jgi:hypothetical protein